MKVFDIEGFPNPARVRIALAEKGATDQVEFVPVDVMAGEHRTDAYKARNPDATVPYIELDDGSCISQCTAITEYIDGTFEGTDLIGSTPTERDRGHMMNLRAEAGLVDAVGTYFHHATPGLGPDLETYQNAEWGIKKKDVALNTMRYLVAYYRLLPILPEMNFPWRILQLLPVSLSLILQKLRSQPTSHISWNGAKE